MENYYTLLGVSPKASLAEIKRAFRQKVKSIHPDAVNSVGVANSVGAVSSAGAGQQMSELIQAYKILVDAAKRCNYNSELQFTRRQKEPFNYREWLLKRSDDPESMAKLIFYDLLHLREGEAVKRYVEMGGPAFSMREYFEREEWMDCSFILAEELDRAGDPWAACRLLFDIIEEENKNPWFRHFFPDVLQYLKEIVRLRLVPQTDPELVLDILEEMVRLPMPQKERARYWRMLGDAYDAIDEEEQAQRAWSQALNCDGNLKLARNKMQRLQREVL